MKLLKRIYRCYNAGQKPVRLRLSISEKTNNFKSGKLKTLFRVGTKTKIMINRLSKEIHENNKQKGFYESEKNIGEMLALIHSEVSEALEADRKDMYAEMVDTLWSDLYKEEYYFKHAFKEYCKDTFEDELSDIMIRVMDLAAYKEIDLEKHIQAKIDYNETRGFKHGKNY